MEGRPLEARPGRLLGPSGVCINDGPHRNSGPQRASNLHLWNETREEVFLFILFWGETFTIKQVYGDYQQWYYSLSNIQILRKLLKPSYRSCLNKDSRIFCQCYLCRGGRTSSWYAWPPALLSHVIKVGLFLTPSSDLYPLLLWLSSFI